MDEFNRLLKASRELLASRYLNGASQEEAFDRPMRTHSLSLVHPRGSQH